MTRLRSHSWWGLRWTEGSALTPKPVPLLRKTLFMTLVLIYFLSQVNVSKVGVPDVGLEPFTPQGEAPGFELLASRVIRLGVGFMAGLGPSLPRLLPYGFLVLCLMCSWHPARLQLFFLRGNCSICNCRLSVPGEGGECRNFLCPHLTVFNVTLVEAGMEDFIQREPSRSV